LEHLKSQIISEAGLKQYMLCHIPNGLTFMRIIASPIVLCLIISKGEMDILAALFIFSFASLTDLLDGHLARKCNAISKFGEFLDPIADKVLVCPVIVAMLCNNKITGSNICPSIIILIREFLTFYLRVTLTNDNKQEMSVTSLSKIKTACQMIAISLNIFNCLWDSGFISKSIGSFFFWLSAFLSALTFYMYARRL
jgi:CDP-diacylglycerol--glycerol-3-phosphate 3-phosphatidyltransferase